MRCENRIDGIIRIDCIAVIVCRAAEIVMSLRSSESMSVRDYPVSLEPACLEGVIKPN